MHPGLALSEFYVTIINTLILTQFKFPPFVDIGLLDIVPNQGGIVITKVDPAYSGTEGIKLIVRVELIPVVALELVKEQLRSGDAR